jgi:hypothetical protein
VIKSNDKTEKKATKPKVLPMLRLRPPSLRFPRLRRRGRLPQLRRRPPSLRLCQPSSLLPRRPLARRKNPKPTLETWIWPKYFGDK